jgi:AraC-like DNA-binding protein
MELAKWLLQEKKSSVGETAYTLGYEKVSTFISMFKKFHKILPGSLIRRERQDKANKKLAKYL